MQNFDYDKMTGVWYTHDSIFYLIMFGGSCENLYFGYYDNGTIRVSHSAKSLTTGVMETYNGTVTMDDSSVGTLQLLAEDLKMQPTLSLNVLDTDYETYCVIWACSDLDSERSVRFAWKLTRERSPDDSVLETADAVFKKWNINTNYLIAANQTYCDA